MKVLTYTTLYPNARQPRHGIFIETRLRALLARHPVEARVIAPVPWFPSRSPRFGRYAVYADVPRREQRHGIEVQHPRYPVIPRIGMNLAPALLAAATLPTCRALDKEGFRFDLIDAHYFYPDGVAAALIARWMDRPLAITARGSDINQIAGFALPRRQIRWAIRQADASIGVCESLRQDLGRLEPHHGLLRKLRNGVDLELFRPPGDRPALRRELGLTGSVVLSVGNLIELKGHHLVIDALVDLPGTSLVVVGDGPWRERLQQQADDAGISDRVRFTGNIEPAVLRDYYGAADVMVLASSREGWANVLLESMACGTPVVATAVFGTPEVVASPDAGVLVDERSVAALREALSSLLATPPAREATRRYAQSFSWDETADGLWETFVTILQARDLT